MFRLTAWVRCTHPHLASAWVRLALPDSRRRPLGSSVTTRKGVYEMSEPSPAEYVTEARGWTRRLCALAFAAAVGVSVIYLPQTLLTDLAANLGVSAGTASVVATTVQTGYAVGIFFLVPLSDRVQPRRQVTVQLVALAIAMLVAAVSPEIVRVTVGFFAVGFVANIAQLIIPTAGRLAPAGRRGAATGALVGAVGVGIFGGRILASLLVGALGWRWVVVVFAGLVLATVPFARRALPAELAPASAHVPYPALVAATVRRLRTSSALVQSSALQFLVFATFNSMWTVSVLHLTGHAFGWTVQEAGLFGVVGLVAAVITPVGGRIIDRFGTAPMTTAFLAVMLAATTAATVDSGSAWLFALSMFLVTLANQTIQAANQHRVLITHPDGAAQANTAFMVSVFLGGSLGAFLGPLAYTAGGMPLVALQAVVLVTLACTVWALSLAHERRRTRAAVLHRPKWA